MKSFSLFFALALIASLSFGQELKLESEPQEEKGVPVLSFDEMSYNFGDIKQGDKVSHTFTFTNTGSAPLLINRVQTTCGCTVPKWPKEPIAPNGTGEISATFNSSGKQGIQNKAITIHSNASEPVMRLTLKSNVLKAAPPAGSGK